MKERNFGEKINTASCSERGYLTKPRSLQLAVLIKAESVTLYSGISFSL
jgi:hypothetical protein